MDKYPKYISEKQQELFESYLMHKMSLDEKKSFESSLTEDQNLHDYFQEFKALFEIVEEEGLKSKLDGFHKAIDQETSAVVELKTSKPKFNYRIAASVAILFAIGVFWFLNQPNTNEKLFNEYYSQDPGLPTVMGSNDNYDFYEAMVDYKQGNYEIAINKWEKLLLEKPQNDTLNYFLGVSHLAKGNEKSAIAFLNKVAISKESAFKKEARYYLGLAHLKKGELKKAKTNLAKSNIVNSQQILDKLTN